MVPDSRVLPEERSRMWQPMNLKKMPGGSKNAADVQNVDIDKLGEIGKRKKAYLVSQYEKKQNTGGGKK